MLERLWRTETRIQHGEGKGDCCCPIPLDAPVTTTIWFLIGLSFVRGV